MSIGETLAEARQQAGLTVTQVSGATRIRETVVQAIERDDFSSCGGNFYTRGHIRSIGQAIGLDPEPLVREYDETHGGAPHALPATSLVDADSRPVRLTERRKPNWSAAMVVALVVLVGLYGGFRLVGAQGGEQPPPTAAGNQQPSPVPTSSSSASPSSPSPSLSESNDAVALAPNGDVTVRLRALDASWISVLNSKGELVYEGLIQAGDTQEWQDSERLKLTVGNAGGVELTVNGEKVGSPGDTGEVMRLTFGPKDPRGG